VEITLKNNKLILFPVMLIFFLTLWHRRIIIHCNAENAG